jgi:hypothetical protein
MPRFFFDFLDNGRLFPDTEGSELADVAEARAEALATLCQVAKDASYETDNLQLKATVRSETGQTLLTASVDVIVERQLS